ncbi:MAG: hypothetical protein U0228_30780 [Myxococcaceae bacterium]
MFTGEIRRARSKRPLYIAIGVVVVIALIALLVPMPHPVATTFELTPGATTEVLLPRDGTIGEIVTTDGSMVAKGTVIAKFDVSAAEKELPELEKKVAALEERKAAGGKVTPAAKAALTKAEAALKKEEAALEKATKAGKGKTTPAMGAAQKKVDAAKEALEKAQLAVGPSGDELEKVLTESKDKVAALKAEVSSANVTSPGSGLLELKLEKGATLKKDAKLGTVSDLAKLKALVKVPASETTTKGQAVELVLASGKKRVTLAGPATGDTAEAELDNQKGEFKPGLKGEATLEGEQRSFLSGLMGK